MIALDKGRPPLMGDWRANYYGAARRVHLWNGSEKRPVCGARIDRQKTARVSSRRLNDLCYECLLYGAMPITYR